MEGICDGSVLGAMENVGAMEGKSVVGCIVGGLEIVGEKLFVGCGVMVGDSLVDG